MSCVIHTVVVALTMIRCCWNEEPVVNNNNRSSGDRIHRTLHAVVNDAAIQRVCVAAA